MQEKHFPPSNCWYFAHSAFFRSLNWEVSVCSQTEAPHQQCVVMHGIYFTGLTLFLTFFPLFSSANANDAWIEIPLSLSRGVILKSRKKLEQQSISRTSDTMPFLFFSQFAPRKTFLWKTGKNSFILCVCVKLSCFSYYFCLSVVM